MFQSIPLAPPDPILGLNEAFQNDPNPRKINLSVGVFKDASGQTPVLQCVKEAERRLLDKERTKDYLGIGGLADYGKGVLRLLGGDALAKSPQAAVVQTPGGTGALRVAADFLASRYPAATVWVSKPTWANHPNVFQRAGVAVAHYAYLDAAGAGLDWDGMLRDLEQAQAGDVVLLHACCHNPTGVDLNGDQWAAVAAFLRERQLLPLVDCAYQGFGDGLQEDIAGVGKLLQLDPPIDLLICSSYSKNFSLYGERVGALAVHAQTAEGAAAALSHLKASVRANYSNPPKHGAAIVAAVLDDAELHQQWTEELRTMRERIQAMRRLFVDRLQAAGVDQDFSFIARQKGMFSFSGLNPMQVDRLRSEYSIYIVGSGRINVAGITAENVGPLCDAIGAVVGQ